MKITKSTRHQKIIGHFGETLLCNWLSRSGFEVSIIDHTGIDVIAYNPSIKQRLGISVKSRTRQEKTEEESVNIFSYKKEKSDRQKALEACEAFACEAWIAIYVECISSADLYLLSLKHYDKKYRGEKSRVIDTWKMGGKYKLRYDKDPDVKTIHMEFSGNSWIWSDEESD